MVATFYSKLVNVPCKSHITENYEFCGAPLLLGLEEFWTDERKKKKNIPDWSFSVFFFWRFNTSNSFEIGWWPRAARRPVLGPCEKACLPPERMVKILIKVCSKFKHLSFRKIFIKVSFDFIYFFIFEFCFRKCFYYKKKYLSLNIFHDIYMNLLPTQSFKFLKKKIWESNFT